MTEIVVSLNIDMMFDANAIEEKIVSELAKEFSSYKFVKVSSEWQLLFQHQNSKSKIQAYQILEEDAIKVLSDEEIENITSFLQDEIRIIGGWGALHSHDITANGENNEEEETPKSDFILVFKNSNFQTIVCTSNKPHMSLPQSRSHLTSLLIIAIPTLLLIIPLVYLIGFHAGTIYSQQQMSIKCESFWNSNYYQIIKAGESGLIEFYRIKEILEKYGFAC